MFMIILDYTLSLVARILRKEVDRLLVSDPEWNSHNYLHVRLLPRKAKSSLLVSIFGMIQPTLASDYSSSNSNRI